MYLRKYIINKSFELLVAIYFFLILIFQIFILRKKLIIVCDKYGRLGNRLFLISQFIEYSERTGFEIWVPGFHDYQKYFKRTKELRFLRFPLNKTPIPNPFSGTSTFNAFNKILNIYSFFGSNNFLHKLSFYNADEGNPFSVIDSSPSKSVLFTGFIFHEHFLEIKSAFKLIQKTFEPASCYAKKIEDPIIQLRARSELVIGVLIRQTDYRKWNDGKCFFTSSEYVRILKRLKVSFQNTNLSFFIATDEEQDPLTFEGLETIIRVGHPIENLYSLAMCDILIGPSSSYIGWASLYGKLPLFTIQSPDDFPKKSNFNFN